MIVKLKNYQKLIYLFLQFFVALSWMAKATVQAVLGVQTVAHLPANATTEEKVWANIILTVCVLSIVVTAPTGAILITLTGSKLLSKTKQPPNLEGKIYGPNNG